MGLDGAVGFVVGGFLLLLIRDQALLRSGSESAWIGFTVSLFVSDLASPESPLVDVAKLGILAASLIAGVVGWLILRGASSPR